MKKVILIGSTVMITVIQIVLLCGYLLQDVHKVKSTSLDKVLVGGLSINHKISEDEYREHKKMFESHKYGMTFKVYKTGIIDFIYVHVNAVNLSIDNHINKFQTVDDVITVLGNQYVEINDGYSIRLNYYDEKNKIKLSIEYFENDRNLEWITLSKY